jgi:predicted MFS family arabinose efflux permease
MISAFLFGAGFAAFFLFAPILSERRGMPSGLPYAVYGVGIIATRLTTGRWLDRTGTRTVLLVAAALTIAGLLAAAFAVTPIVLAIAAFLAAAGGGLFHPALIVHHARMLPGAPGRSTAAFYVGFDLGIGLGSWLFGLVLDLSGLTALYVTAAAIIVLTVPLTIWVLKAPAVDPEDRE